MIDLNKILRFIVITLLSIAILLVGVFALSVYQKGTDYRVTKLLSNAQFSKLVGSKMYYYTGDHFAYYDVASGKTQAVSSINYAPDVTGVLWLKDGIVFSADKTDTNSDVTPLKESTWYTRYDGSTGVIPLEVSPMSDIYNFDKVSFYITDENIIRYYNNQDYQNRGVVLLSAAEQYISTEGECIWTYDRSKNILNCHSINKDGEVTKTIKPPGDEFDPLSVSGTSVVHRNNESSGEHFDVFLYDSEKDSNKQLLSSVAGLFFNNDVPVFVGVGRDVLELQQVQKGSITTDGYVKEKGLAIPSNVYSYEDDYLYMTHQQDLYLLDAGNSKRYEDYTKRTGIERLSNSETVSLKRLITAGNPNQYDVYFKGNFSEARSYVTSLFKENEYDINHFSFRYIKVNQS